MSTETNENQEPQATQVAEAKTKKQVPMSDGTVITFSEKQVIKTQVDQENFVIKFYLVDGNMITWDWKLVETLADITNIKPMFAQMVLSAATNRVKNNTAIVPLIGTKKVKVKVAVDDNNNEIFEEQEQEYPALFEAIQSCVEQINKGSFNLRASADVDDSVLTLDEIAYALFEILTNQVEEYKNLTSLEVVSKIKDSWTNLSKEDRKPIRSNSNFKMLKATAEGFYQGTESSKIVIKAMFKGVRFPEAIA